MVCAGGVAALNYARNQFGPPTTQPQALPTVSVLPGESVVYQSSLTNSPDGWSNDQYCHAASDGLHVSDNHVCIAPAGDQPDVDVRVGVMLASGPLTNAYGISFRLTTASGQVASEYEFLITASSYWEFRECQNGTCTRILDFTSNNAILGGLNTTNTLEVRATGHAFAFYANGTQLGTANDTDIASGRVGLVAGAQQECAYSNLVLARPE